MIAYLDSSAIVKQFLADEIALIDVGAVVGGNTVAASSRLSYVEVRASLAAARRSDRLSSVEHDRALASFEEMWAAYVVVELSDGVSARAGSIAEVFALRAGDAVQLASALEFDARDTTMVAWDARLRFAARRAGLATYPAGI